MSAPKLHASRGHTGAPVPPASLPYVHGNRVPVVCFGLGVKPGTYRRDITVHEIAPTLAANGIETPSGAFGNALPELAP